MPLPPVHLRPSPWDIHVHSLGAPTATWCPTRTILQVGMAVLVRTTRHFASKENPIIVVIMNPTSHTCERQKGYIESKNSPLVHALVSTKLITYKRRIPGVTFTYLMSSLVIKRFISLDQLSMSSGLYLSHVVQCPSATL